MGSKPIKPYLLQNFSNRLLLREYLYPGPCGEDADPASANLAMSDHRVLRRCAWNGRCRAKDPPSPTFRHAPTAYDASKRSRYAGP
jgi:hypothetical protein